MECDYLYGFGLILVGQLEKAFLIWRVSLFEVLGLPLWSDEEGY